MGFLKRQAPVAKRLREVDALDVPFVTRRHVESPTTCFFYHTTDLPGFGVQEGGWDLRNRFLDYIGHVNLKGKRVLDVGSASGFLTFEAERYSAREVVSFDLDTAERQDLLPFAASDYVTDHAGWCRRQTEAFRTWQNAYWLAHRLLESRAKAFYGDVYDLPAGLGTFDVIIVGAILEHLADPLKALYSLSRHAGDFIIINTDYIDSPDPVAMFNGRADRPTNSFTFWTYSIALYDEYMKIMGFRRVAAHKDKFAGTPSVAGAARPLLERVALVYRKKIDGGLVTGDAE